MKNIINIETCQTELTNYDRFVLLTRYIINSRGRCSYSHTNIAKSLGLSRRTIIRYSKRLEEDPSFVISKKFWSTNWITFACLSVSLLLSTVTLASFSYEFININSYSYNRKRDLTPAQQKRETQRWESITMNANKMFKDSDAQPDYVQKQKQQKQEASKFVSTIKVPSGYEKILITQAKILADQVERGITIPSIALRKLGNLKRDCPNAIEPFKKWMNTPDGRQVMALFTSSS